MWSRKKKKKTPADKYFFPNHQIDSPSLPLRRHSLLDARHLCAAFVAAPHLRDEREDELRGPPSPRGGRGHGGQHCLVLLGGVFVVVGIDAALAGCGAPPRLRRGRRGPPQQPQAGPGRYCSAVRLAEDRSCAGERNYASAATGRGRERRKGEMVTREEVGVFFPFPFSL